jgi:pimeloyl-ACP methyl ester carboxylesterase
MESVLISEPKCASNGTVKIRYEHVASQNGKNLIFIMGLSIDAFGWSNRFLQPFIEAGFGVIRIDNRCTGGSSFVKNWGKTKFDLTDMAADAVAVLDDLKIDAVHAVGVSLGGMIVQQMAISFPERVSGITSIMSGANVNLFTLSLRSYWTFLRLGHAAAKPRKLKGFEKYTAINTEIWQVLDPKNIDDTDVDWIRALSEYQFKHKQMIRPDSAPHQMLAVLRSKSRITELNKLPLPKLVIHGDADNLIPLKHAQQFAEKIQNTQLLILKDMGHTLPRRYHATMFEAIDKLISTPREA